MNRSWGRADRLVGCLVGGRPPAGLSGIAWG